jgi:hypothetical protein
MNGIARRELLAGLGLALTGAARGAPGSAAEREEAISLPPALPKVLTRMVGAWQGTRRTWFEPGKLGEEVPISGRIAPILRGMFLRHEYGAPVQGRTCRGEDTPDGFSVLGQYEPAPGAPAWGWKTHYAFAAPDRLTITAWNVTPQGEEAQALETQYRRVHR